MARKILESKFFEQFIWVTLVMLCYFYLACTLSGCGVEEGQHYAKTESAPVVINPEFNDYYTRFQADTGASPWNVSIDFGVLYGSDDVAGSCYHSYLDGTDKITVSVKYWAMYNDVSKELLIYHELGHCVLHREHVTDHDSIMQPVLFDTIKGYEADKQTYIDELIGK